MLQGKKKKEKKDRGIDLDFHVDLVSCAGSLLRRPHSLLVTAEDDLHEAIRRKELAEQQS